MDAASVVVQSVVERRATFSRANLPGKDYALSLDQTVAVEQIATSGRLLDVLVGPAGMGKSTTMAGLRAAWDAEHGPGSVLGLAPSAAAAEVLADELGIDTENTAKWLHEHRREPERLGRIADLRDMLASPSISSLRRSSLCRRVAAAEAEAARWRLRAGQLVIVGEASLAGTFALDELVTTARAAGAKVLLVGDGAQLTAVEAGGGFAALVRDRNGPPPELSDIRRFRNEWEKAASVELRAGSEDAIDAYQAHDRITEGDRDAMLDAIYRAWKDDTDTGKTSLMIACDLATVSELNARARTDRIAAGQVAEEGLAVAGRQMTGAGDRVVTRRNERRLSTGGRWVRNGDGWTVTATHKDGTMTVKRTGRGGGTVVLPADYVREHVELAYASTAHRAQGGTVDTAHAMVAPTTTREVLYVTATRGRDGNWLYVDTHYDPDPETSHDGITDRMTAREVLAGVLRSEGADVAAQDMIRREHDDAEGMERLSAEYLTLATAAQAERRGALLARRRLPGPLAHHRPTSHRERGRRDEHRAEDPAPTGAGRHSERRCHQPDRERATGKRQPGRADRDAEGSRKMSKRKDANALARWTEETRQWATERGRDLALDLYYDRETTTRPYGVGVVLDPGEKAWAEVPVTFNLDWTQPAKPGEQAPQPAVRPWLVTSARIVGRLADDRLHGYRWQKTVGARVDLTPGREAVILDVDGEPTLAWSGPGVTPIAVAAVFHLHGPLAMIDHPGLAPLRLPIDASEPPGPASIEPPSHSEP